MEQVLATRQLSKYFYDPKEFQVLKEIDLTIHQGEFVSIMGKSGCGKSTLLYVLSTMDTDYQGELYLGGDLLNGRPGSELSRLRNEKIGFVFQFHYLLAEISVLRNVMLPGLKLGRLPESKLRKKALELLDRLGIPDEANKKANKLSGGQKQRVAIARALINDPMIIMGDEPTGNLDSVNSRIVLDIFQEIARESQQSLLIVTHDEDFAKATDRIITMQDGRIIGDERQERS